MSLSLLEGAAGIVPAHAMGERLLYMYKEMQALVGFRWATYERDFGFENLHYRLVAMRDRSAAVSVPEGLRWQNTTN